MKKLVCILGMHRSGTSMLANLIKNMGIYMGEINDLYEETVYNQDGHFELKQIVDLHDQILKHYNRSWYDVASFNIDLDESFIKICKEKIKGILSDYLQDKEYFGIKDPRMCIMLPLWEAVFAELDYQVQYIIITRNPVEVSKSLKKRDGLPLFYGEKLWCYYNNELLKHIKGRKVFLVNYDKILQNKEWINKLFEFIYEKSCQEQILQKVIKNNYKHETFEEQGFAGKDNLQLLYNTFLKYTKGALQENDIYDLRNEWHSLYCLYCNNNKKEQRRNFDLQLMNNLEEIEKKHIVIYGAGKCGKEVLQKLYQMGIVPDAFCDIAAEKIGKYLYGVPVYDLKELEVKSGDGNTLVVIAIENIEIADHAKDILNFFDVKMVSYYAMLMAGFFFTQKRNKKTEIENTLEWLKRWYEEQYERADLLDSALNAAVIVYQNGKVGSSTILHSLQNSQVNAVHLHRIRFFDDILQTILCNENEYNELARRISFSCERELIKNYICSLNDREDLKIISLVREPISVDVSTIFQWLGTKKLDGYIKSKDENFSTILINLILKIKNRLFQWFEEEFMSVFDINIYDYPFDQNSGYVHIKKDNKEILILQAEKINQLENVIGNFAGCENFKIHNFNQSTQKGYRDLYKQFIDEIVLPKEYIDFYYNNNELMNYFYSKKDQKK